jgi:molybdopterin converting factor small subunit
VELRVYATLRKYLPDQPLGEGTLFRFEPGTSVAGLLEQAGVPLDQVKIIMVNNRHTGPEHVLADGDRVAAFPPVAGG